MPKRILDGERIWNSRMIALLQPEHRPEYPWIYPLALANGVFDCSATHVWFNCYRNRPQVSLEKVQQIIDDFVNVGLLFRWREPDGSEWGYWTGAHTQYGILPAKSRLNDGHYALGPEPPAGEFQRYAAKYHLRTNGHGPGSTIDDEASDAAKRRQLAEHIRDLKSKKQL